MSVSTELIEKPQEILKYLQIGINIPVSEEFHEYILYDLKNYSAKSIILKENKKLIGHVLVYDDGGDVLFFGFFGVENHKEKYITLLLSELIEYANKNRFGSICGPINPPTFIYGWGFMEEGSLDNLSISKPVNPPIYQDLFFQSGFYVKSKQGTWEGAVYQISEEELKKYDFEEYEVYQPKDWDDILKLKLPILILSARNLAPESQVTPSPQNLFENFFAFVKHYGDIYMLKLLRDKHSRQFVGCFITLPNPFSKNPEGKYDSFVGYSLTINKEHRNKGLSMYLVKEIYNEAYKNHIRRISVPMEINVFECKNLVKENLGFSYTRTHLILEFMLK